MQPSTRAVAAALLLGACLRASQAASVSSGSASAQTPALSPFEQATANFEAQSCTAAACLIPNPCEGTKPTAEGFANKQCIVDGLVVAVEQSGANVTQGYQGLLNTTAEPITTPYSEAGLCPVNVHWHLGTEHLSVGQYDEQGTGPSAAGGGHRRSDGSVRKGYQCLHYDDQDPIYTTPFDWKYCENMEVGQTYEVHWPHSKGGDCGTIHQYQTPFYDGVFCNAGRLAPTTQAAIGVQSQTFVIVNDESYYYDNLFAGMILNNETAGTDMAFYTGSTTGTSRDNEICSSWAPITWQVDRTCQIISASSFDKMCKVMKEQNDDMSGDVHPHGSRELVADHLAANNQVDGAHGGRARRAGDAHTDAVSCACLEERVCEASEEAAAAKAAEEGGGQAACHVAEIAGVMAVVSAACPKLVLSPAEEAMIFFSDDDDGAPSCVAAEFAEKLPHLVDPQSDLQPTQADCPTFQSLNTSTCVGDDKVIVDLYLKDNCQLLTCLDQIAAVERLTEQQRAESALFQQAVAEVSVVAATCAAQQTESSCTDPNCRWGDSDSTTVGGLELTTVSPLINNDDDNNDDDFTFGQVVGIVIGALAGVALLVAVAQRQWIGNGCPADAAAGAETPAVTTVI